MWRSSVTAYASGLRSSAAVAAFGTEGRAAILAIVIDEIVDLVKNVYGKSLVRLLDLKERRPE